MSVTAAVNVAAVAVVTVRSRNIPYPAADFISMPVSFRAAATVPLDVVKLVKFILVPF